MKPIKPHIGDDGDYRVDALVREGTELPAEMQTALRNLLLACELGGLVVVQCTRIEDDAVVYILGAYAQDHQGEQCILPICELSTPANLAVSMRPPQLLQNKRFKKPVQLSSSVDLIAVDEGVAVLASLEKREDDSVH